MRSDNSFLERTVSMLGIMPIIKIESGKIIVTDPIFEDDKPIIFDAMNGEWGYTLGTIPDIDPITNKLYGHRVGGLSLSHKDFDNFPLVKFIKNAGEIAIESASIGIFDAGKLDEIKLAIAQNGYARFNKVYNTGLGQEAQVLEPWKDYVFDAVNKRIVTPYFSHGILSKTGYGDGSYPISAGLTVDNGMLKVCYIAITFIEEE